jgi:aminopeptidase-like protein
MLDLLSHADGTRSLLDIADLIGLPFREVSPLARLLADHDLLLLEPFPQ